jgi:hypothetical protein
VNRLVWPGKGWRESREGMKKKKRKSNILRQLSWLKKKEKKTLAVPTNHFHICFLNSNTVPTQISYHKYVPLISPPPFPRHPIPSFPLCFHPSINYRRRPHPLPTNKISFMYIIHAFCIFVPPLHYPIQQLFNKFVIWSSVRLCGTIMRKKKPTNQNKTTHTHTYTHTHTSTLKKKKKDIARDNHTLQTVATDVLLLFVLLKVEEKVESKSLLSHSTAQR